MEPTSSSNGKLNAPKASPRGDDEAQLQSIASTNEALLQAAHAEKYRKVGAIADNPRVHEIVENDVIRPAQFLSGK